MEYPRMEEMKRLLKTVGWIERSASLLGAESLVPGGYFDLTNELKACLAYAGDGETRYACVDIRIDSYGEVHVSVGRAF